MRVAKVFLVVVVSALVLVGVLAMCIETVPVAKIGVRQTQWGGGGIDEKNFDTGFRLGITGFHKWYFLDRRTHFLTFASQSTKSGQSSRVGALEVRTKDGNFVNFDLTVTYRIIPEEGFEMVKDGLQNIYRERLEAVVEKEMREQLAELSSEDIYLTDRRNDIVATALPRLTAAMASYHVEPESILIRAVSFEQSYEQQLQAKQLFSQKTLLAQSKKLVEDERATTEKLSAEIEAAEKELRGDWDKRLQEESSTNKVTIAEILAEAEVYDKTKRATADADYETLIADGRLAVDKSEALRNELRNKALNTLGGRIYLARQAAENLQFDHVTLNSNDPSVPSILDVNELVKLLVGEQD